MTLTFVQKDEELCQNANGQSLKKPEKTAPYWNITQKSTYVLQ